MSGWPSGVRGGLHAFSTVLAAVGGVCPATGTRWIEAIRHVMPITAGIRFFIGPRYTSTHPSSCLLRQRRWLLLRRFLRGVRGGPLQDAGSTEGADHRFVALVTRKL